MLARALFFLHSIARIKLMIIAAHFALGLFIFTTFRIQFKQLLHQKMPHHEMLELVIHVTEDQDEKSFLY